MAELQKARVTKLDKRFGPRSEDRKQQMKLTRCDAPGAREFVPNYEDGRELREAVRVGDDFRYQDLIDHWRSYKW